MAKSKNHTNRNKSRKDHKNGIDKPKKFQFSSALPGLCQKFKRNLKYARKGQLTVSQQKKRFQGRQRNQERIAACTAAKK